MSETDPAVLVLISSIDRKLEIISNEMVRKESHAKLENRVDVVEKQATKLAIKVAGIATTISLISVWVFSIF